MSHPDLHPHLPAIKSRIVEVISLYVPLTRSGKDFKGLCPFHTDTDPSFSVSGDKGFFTASGAGPAAM